MKREKPSPILVETLALLKKTDTALPQIAQETGLGYEWLKKLRAGAIPDPSINRVHKLHLYLTRT